MKKIIPLLSAALLLGACSIVTKTPEPAWTSLKKEGSIEIRQYDPMIVAEVTVTGERYAAINDGFRLLADYIFGNNTTSKSIAMTAPVIQEKDSTKIAMTAPVMQEKSKDSWKVRFVMPKEYTLKTIPKPNNEKVTLIEIPKYQVAVIRFSGRNTDENLKTHEGKLLKWLDSQAYKTIGVPTYAFYNPPWTLPFMKRNEVMVNILK